MLKVTLSFIPPKEEISTVKSLLAIMENAQISKILSQFQSALLYGKSMLQWFKKNSWHHFPHGHTFFVKFMLAGSNEKSPTTCTGILITLTDIPSVRGIFAERLGRPRLLHQYYSASLNKGHYSLAGYLQLADSASLFCGASGKPSPWFPLEELAQKL